MAICNHTSLNSAGYCTLCGQFASYRRQPRTVYGKEGRPPEFAKSDDLDLDATNKTPEMVRILEMRRACLDFLESLAREGWIADEAHTDEMRYVWECIFNEYEKTRRGQGDLSQLEEKDFQLPTADPGAVSQLTWQHTMSATVYVPSANKRPVNPTIVESVFEKLRRMENKHGKM